MRTVTRLIGLLAPVLLLSAAALTAPASAASGTNLYSHLNGSKTYPTASGSSYYHMGMGMMGSRDVDVTLTNGARLAGQRVRVFVNGTRIGTMLVSSTGYAHHRWYGSSLPYCMGGSRVLLRTSGGTIVVTGTYRSN